MGYRGGYLPTERRKIEKGLRTGDIYGVVSTNALELGVDIGQLQVCIMTGYPGTISSAWQQAEELGDGTGKLLWWWPRVQVRSINILSRTLITFLIKVQKRQGLIPTI